MNTAKHAKGTKTLGGAKMRTMPNQAQITKRKDDWQKIRWRMNERRITPEELAHKTQYSPDLIERGVRGEPIPITDDFIHKCVMAFNLTSSRIKYFEETVYDLPYDECIEIIGPPSAMPPRQGNFWNWD